MGPKVDIQPIGSPMPDVLLVESDTWRDERGVFCEQYREDELCHRLGVDRFIQLNISQSFKHVMRGLHYQVKKPQGKLVRAAAGSAIFTVLDMREGSQTAGFYRETTLDRPEIALWVPPGYATGFLASTDVTIVYSCTSYYEVGYDRAVQPPTYQLNSPHLIRSEKDIKAPTFAFAEKVPMTEWSPRNI